MTAAVLSTGAPLAAKDRRRPAGDGKFSLGLLVDPLHEAFGWTRAEVSAPVLIT